MACAPETLIRSVGFNRVGGSLALASSVKPHFFGIGVTVDGRIVRTDPDKYFGRDFVVWPKDLESVQFRSKLDVRYPHFTLLAKLPRLSPVGDEKLVGLIFGLESDVGFGNGLLAFWLLKDSTRDNWLYLAVRCREEYKNLLATTYLPSDFDTKQHSYSILVSRCLAMFKIDGDPICFAVFGGKAEVVKENVRPYSLLVLPRMAAGLNALVEIASNRVSKAPADATYEGLGWHYLWVNEGHEVLPLRLPLYPEDSGTPLAGQSIDGSVTCHPVPVHGYSPAFYFHADGDADLIIEILSRNGNWREYDSDRFTAGTNRIWRYQMPRGSAMIARVRIEPVSPPITVNDAEVILA